MAQGVVAAFGARGTPGNAEYWQLRSRGSPIPKVINSLTALPAENPLGLRLLRAVLAGVDQSVLRTASGLAVSGPFLRDLCRTSVLGGLTCSYTRPVGDPARAVALR